MYVTDCEYADIVTMQHLHRYDLMNDDGTRNRHIISDIELSLDEIMMKFNESDIWFISKIPFGQRVNTYWYVNMVNEMKNDPKYRNLFDEQAKRLRRMQIEEHKSEIRAEAEIYKEK